MLMIQISIKKEGGVEFYAMIMYNNKEYSMLY